MKYVAVAALLLTVATLPVWGGVLFALFLFGLFLLAVVGVPRRARGPHRAPARRRARATEMAQWLVGDRRLRARPRLAHHDRRIARRSLRAPARLRARARLVHGRLPARRLRLRPARARARASAPGRRRCGHVRNRPRPDRAGVSRPGAHGRAGRLGRDTGCCAGTPRAGRARRSSPRSPARSRSWPRSS
jgi:hypothetical protein